jgi:hypothetical protein
MTQGFGGQPAAARIVCTVGEHTFHRRRVGLVGIHINKVRHQCDRLSTDALVFRYAQEKLAAARVVRLVGRGSSSASGLFDKSTLHPCSK